MWNIYIIQDGCYVAHKSEKYFQITFLIKVENTCIDGKHASSYVIGDTKKRFFIQIIYF